MNALKSYEDRIAQEVDDMDATLMEMIEADDLDAIGTYNVQMMRHMRDIERMTKTCGTYESNTQLYMAEGFYRISCNILKREMDRVRELEIWDAMEVSF